MSEDPRDFEPLSREGGIATFPIGNLPLSAHHQRLAAPSGVSIHPNAWIDSGEFAAFLESGASELRGAASEMLIRREASASDGSTRAAVKSFRIRFPWDVIRANEAFVSALDEDRIEGDVHPSVVIEGLIHVGPGTRILPGVYVEGNVVIGANCKIGPNCYLRGNTSIGDQCHIGQSVEIKNCVILSRTNVGHLSYVGDSVLGQGVNFGAGTTTSNLRHDGASQKSMVRGELIDTGRRKLGAIVGDGVHTGIHTSIYPGRKLWPRTTTRPGEVVERDITG